VSNSGLAASIRSPSGSDNDMRKSPRPVPGSVAASSATGETGACQRQGEVADEGGIGAGHAHARRALQAGFEDEDRDREVDRRRSGGPDLRAVAARGKLLRNQRLKRAAAVVVPCHDAAALVVERDHGVGLGRVGPQGHCLPRAKGEFDVARLGPANLDEAAEGLEALGKGRASVLGGGARLAATPCVWANERWAGRSASARGPQAATRRSEG
jgi:hypothetical protein